MEKPIISFKNFGFQYRAQQEPTLRDINLDIYPGERILIAGPSGSGKSTLGNCLNGLIPFAYSGTVTGSLTVDGVDAPNSSIFELSSHIGTVLPDPDGQLIGLTVAEDIAFAPENDCVEHDELHRRVDEAAKLVDIEDHLGYAPHELSGGQKQRVSLAGVMIEDVKILLFDEPLANLDPAAGQQTMELIDDIGSRTNTTVIIIEHRLEDVLWRHMDRVILIDDGTVQADMTPDELLSTDLLSMHGIREPLYVTALKLAGVKVTPEMRPSHMDTLLLTEDHKALVRGMYRAWKEEAQVPDPEVVLSCENVDFDYREGHPVLRDVSINIHKGEMIAVVGKNGAGKSTLAKLICGFEKQQKGTFTLYGKDLTPMTIRERAAYIGYVMQDPNQMISKPMIYDEVALGLQNSGLSEAEKHEKVEATLKICGLYPFRNWPVSALSFGQKKRLTIADVLVMGPKIIILDEPTAGQDFKHYTDIMEFLKTLNEQGVTVLLITHDMHLMLEYTARAIAFMRGGPAADSTGAEILCSDELVRQTHLKKTSLFSLALTCGIDDPVAFTRCFIDLDRKERSRGR